MKIAYFDLSSGVAGDMIVGALLDAGLDEKLLLDGIKSLKLNGYDINIEKVVRSTVKATHFKVKLHNDKGLSGFHSHSHDHAHLLGHSHSHHHDHRHDHSHEHSHDHGHEPHRNLFDITKIIQGSSLPEIVKQNAIKVFYRLGEAEAKVHGVTIDKIHFHEVGAIDSIVDIVSCCLGFYLLSIDKIYFSAFSFGSGSVKCSHGMMPEPVPATVNLTIGYQSRQTKVKGELTTPTGAAVLTALGSQLVLMPEFSMSASGYGAGTRIQTEVLGAVRVLLGSTNDETLQVKARKVLLVSCNIDDMTPEQIGYLLENLWKISKQDVWLESIHMKKNRSAVQVNILAELSDLVAIQNIIFAHSSSFGFRYTEISKVEFDRKFETVDLDGAKIRVKIGTLGGAIKVSPEYEDCRAYAELKGKALQDVYFQVNQIVKAR